MATKLVHEAGKNKRSADFEAPPLKISEHKQRSDFPKDFDIHESSLHVVGPTWRPDSPIR